MIATQRSRLERHARPAYFALAYTLSWSQWLPLVFSGRVVRVGPDPSHFPGLFEPMIAAFVVTLATRGRRGAADLLGRMFHWRVSPVWYVAALSPLAFGAIGLLAMRLLGQALPAVADFGRMGAMRSMPPAALFLALIPLSGFSEEVGWRGFALPRMQRPLGALGASVLLALPWALWHLPTFRLLEGYRDMAPAMVVGFVLGLACGSIVLAWLFNRSGGSLWMVALYHGGLNLMTATLAARGTLAAVVSTCVMLHAGVLIGLEWDARRRGRPGPMEPLERAAGAR